VGARLTAYPGDDSNILLATGFLYRGGFSETCD